MQKETNINTEAMTIETLNIKIKEGSKRVGSRNAFLASSEYNSLYNQYQKDQRIHPEEGKKSELWVIDDSKTMGNGFFLKNEKGHYLANTGLQFGMCSGPINFKTKKAVVNYCDKNKIAI